MTEYTSEKLYALKEQLEKHGYCLYQVTHFKKHDRVKFGNNDIMISMNLRGKLSENLRGKLSEIALDALVEACIGKK